MRKAALLLLAACAASAANYRVSFKYAGAATETSELNKDAEKAFYDDHVTDDRQRALGRIKVYLDSLPQELTLKNNVVEVAEGSTAVLIASVDLTAVWKAPEDEAALPALQKAALAAGADLAFCPRNQKPVFYVWRCYLVRTTAPPRP